MDENLSKLLFTVIGGLVGIGGALLSSLMTSRAAEKRRLQDQRDRLMELGGQREATLLDQRARQPENPQSLIKKWTSAPPNPEETAFMIGFLTKANEELEETVKETREARKQTAKDKITIAQLEQEHAELELSLAKHRARYEKLKTEEAELKALMTREGIDFEDLLEEPPPRAPSKPS